MFVRVTLAGLGLWLQLGHRVGGLCHNRSEERDLTVLHTNGHHELKVCFCHCQTVEEYQQLLRMRWWPATPLAPRSAFTFNVLRQWHYQNLQGNISAFDFYRSLEFLTDGTLSTACKVGIPSDYTIEGTAADSEVSLRIDKTRSGPSRANGGT